MRLGESFSSNRIGVPFQDLGLDKKYLGSWVVALSNQQVSCEEGHQLAALCTPLGERYEHLLDTDKYEINYFCVGTDSGLGLGQIYSANTDIEKRNFLRTIKKIGSSIHLKRSLEEDGETNFPLFKKYRESR